MESCTRRGLSPSRGTLGPLKISPESSKTSCSCNHFSMPFWITFESILPPNLPPKILWNVSKVDAKRHSILDSMFGSIFNRLLLPTWTSWTQFGNSGLAPNAFVHGFWEIDFLVPFGYQLGSILAPKNPPNLYQKSIPRGIQKNDWFLDRYVLKLAPFGDQNCDPRTIQDGPRMPPRRSQDATKTDEEPQASNSIDVSSDPGRYPIAQCDGVPTLALDFRSCWPHFGTILGAKFALMN